MRITWGSFKPRFEKINLLSSSFPSTLGIFYDFINIEFAALAYLFLECSTRFVIVAFKCNILVSQLGYSFVCIF